MREKATRPALETAENVLHRIYGDDFAGCHVTLESIAEIVQATLDLVVRDDRTLVDALGEVLEAIQVLSTPPEKTQIKDVQHLATLLGERADAIRLVTAKALEAVNAAKMGRE